MLNGDGTMQVLLSDKCSIVASGTFLIRAVIDYQQWEWQHGISDYADLKDRCCLGSLALNP